MASHDCVTRECPFELTWLLVCLSLAADTHVDLRVLARTERTRFITDILIKVVSRVSVLGVSLDQNNKGTLYFREKHLQKCR